MMCQYVFLASYIDKLLSAVRHVPENTPYGPHITLVVIAAERRNQLAFTSGGQKANNIMFYSPCSLSVNLSLQNHVEHSLC